MTYHNRFAPDRKHNKNSKKFKPLKKKCVKCGTTSGQLDINHKDGNRKNNNRSNLNFMCRSCHRKMHAAKNGGRGSIDCGFCDELINNETIVSSFARIIDNPNTAETKAIASKHKNSDIMYVEYILCHANINANRDEFTSNDMQASAATIINKPLNWEHRAKHNIGVHYESNFVAIKDLEADAKAAFAEIDPLEHDFIQVKAAVWEYKFPEEASIMRARAAKGTLSFSMENLFEIAECSQCGEQFAEALHYCDHLLTRRQTGTSSRKFINSNFIGGAVADSPADKGAKLLALATLEDKNIIFSNILSCKLLSEMDIEKEIIPYIVNAGSKDMKINQLDNIPESFANELDLDSDFFADETNKLFPLDCSENISLSAEFIFNHKDMTIYSTEEKLAIVEKLVGTAKEFDIELGDLIENNDGGQSMTIDVNSPEFKQAVSDAVASKLSDIENGAKVAELETSVAEVGAKLIEATAKLEEATKATEAKALEFDEYKLNILNEKTAEARWNTLIEKGLAFEKNADKVKASIANMDDTQFSDFVDTLTEISEAAFHSSEKDAALLKKKQEEQKKKDAQNKGADKKAKASIDPVTESEVALANKTDDGAATASDYKETAVDKVMKSALGLK